MTDTRDALTEAMPREWTTQLVRDRVADALVPVVDRLRRETAATELTDMADRLAKAHDIGPARRCRNRAAAVRANTQEN